MVEKQVQMMRPAPGAGAQLAAGSRTRFPGISSRAYEHPAALTALTAMRRIKGFDMLLRKLSAAISEPVVRMQHLTSAVRVGPRQFRWLHELKAEAAAILDLPDEPELYVRQMGAINACAVGMERPFLVVSIELLDVMEESELRFVLGHELGHVLSGHVLYQTMARILATVGVDALPSVAGLAVSVVEAALNDWHRKSELSCDRAGLLVAQDTDASMSALAKLTAGSRAHDINIEEFLEQAAEFELDATGIKNRLYKYLLPSDSHPILVVRASELDRWVRRGEYGRIVDDGVYPSRDEDAETRVRHTVRNQYAAAKENRLQKASDRYHRQQEKKALSSEHRLGSGE